MTDKQDKEPFSKNKPQEDDELWQNATKDIKKIKKHNDYVNPKPEKPGKRAKRIQTRESLNSDFSLEQTLPAPKATISSYQTDRRTEQKLKRGEIEIEAKLDLHGQSKVQAYESLVTFILSSQKRNKRCVLVITGKGSPAQPEHGSQYGILRTNFSEWVKHPPLDSIILKIQEAQPRHGGKGAFYVLLRKNRNK